MSGNKFFSLGEVKKEISKKPLLKEIDQESLTYKISDEIIYNCGASIGLKGEKGVQKINMDLLQMDWFK